MEIRRYDVKTPREGAVERVHVIWPGYGFTRDFKHSDVADAYVQGLEDAASAVRNAWREEKS